MDREAALARFGGGGGDEADIDIRSRSASVARLFMGAVILGANLLFGLRGLDIANRVLIDTDGHMRYNRVLDLVTGANGWFDGWAHRANAPFGHSMHWTRPLDALMVVLAAPTATVWGWRDGLYFAALVIGPVLHLALGVVVAWASRPLVGVQASFLAGMGVAAQSAILSYAMPGRPDHHVLIVILALGMIGALVRLSVEGRSRWATVAGLWGAGGLWVSTEFLAALGLAFVFLGWLALTRANHLDRFALWLTIGLITTLLIERSSSEYFAIEYDRASVVHLVVAGLAGLAGVALRLTPSADWRARFGVLVGACTAAGLVVYQLFPSFFGGPFVEVPDDVVEIWLVRVAELAPVWQAARERFSDLSLLVGTGVIGLLVGVLRVRSQRHRGTWGFILISLAAFLVLCARSVRFSVYPAALGAIPIASWASARLQTLRGRGLVRALRRVLVMSVVVVGMAYPFMAALAIEGPPEGEPARACNVQQVAVPIALALGSEGSAVVLASLDSGPELLYRLPVAIVADPYHRNIEGIRDSYAIFGDSGTSPLLDRHSVDYVLVCEHDPDRSVYTSGGLYERLLAGENIEGFRPVFLANDSPFKLYERVTG